MKLDLGLLVGFGFGRVGSSFVMWWAGRILKVILELVTVWGNLLGGLGRALFSRLSFCVRGSGGCLIRRLTIGRAFWGREFQSHLSLWGWLCFGRHLVGSA